MFYFREDDTVQELNEFFDLKKIDAVGLATETDTVVYHRMVYEPGTIVLSKNNELYYCYYEDYDDSDWVGYVKEGVIVAPASHFPDGKARMMPLCGVTDTAGTAGAYTAMAWGPTGDTILPDYNRVPTWDNNGTYTDNGNNYAYTPSNNKNSAGFSGSTYYYDSTIKYYGSATIKGLSPYLSDGTLDLHFRSGFTNSTYLNAFSDIDGSVNTNVLYTLGSSYSAATACHNFRNGNNGGMFTTPGTWYLPAMGELVYILPRFTQIRSALTVAGGISFGAGKILWSSSDYDTDSARVIRNLDGIVSYTTKNTSTIFTPFTKV